MGNKGEEKTVYKTFGHLQCFILHMYVSREAAHAVCKANEEENFLNRNETSNETVRTKNYQVKRSREKNATRSNTRIIQMVIVYENHLLARKIGKILVYTGDLVKY